MDARYAARPCAALCACAIAWSAHAAHAGDVVCRPDGPARATVLYFYAGGFVTGQASDPANVGLCHEFAARGYRTRVVEYPLADLPGAVRAARAAARRHRTPTYAVGGSAGGTLAALLAVEGAVEGGVTWAAPTDLLTWPPDRAGRRELRATRRERIAASPYHQVTPRAVPLLLMHDPRDRVVAFDHATRLAERAPTARVRRVRGDYMRHTWRPADRQRILDWLDARTAAGRRP